MKVLFLTTIDLAATATGGAHYSRYILDVVRKVVKCDVTVVVFREQDFSYLRFILNILQLKPIKLSYYNAFVFPQSGHDKYDLIIYDHIWSYRRIKQSTRSLLVCHNIESNRASNSIARRWLRKFEQNIWREAGDIVTISVEDQAVMEKQAKRVVWVPPIMDLDLKRTGTQKPKISSSEPLNLFFVGDPNFYPNKEGVSWFLKQVFPNVTIPVKLRVTGTWKVGDSDVESLGFVEDLADEYRRADVVIIPIKTGAGASVKFFEALGYGSTILSTSMGVRGVPADSLNSCPGVVVSDDECVWARLLSSREWISTAETRPDWYSNPKNEKKVKGLIYDG